MSYTAVCNQCSSILTDDNACHCGGEVAFVFDEPVPSGVPSSMWHYGARLPLADADPVTLGEGATPLLPAPGLIPGLNLWLKDETRNPTGSMKDRAMSVAFSKARQQGIGRTILLSAGGAGIAAAAYAARSGITNVVVVPEDAPSSRVLLCHLYGSKLVQVKGNVEDVLEIVKFASQSGEFLEVSTYRRANPYQAEAPKTIAYEIAESMHALPAAVVVPIGGGGTLAGIYQGFRDIGTDGTPQMVGVQNRNFAALDIAMQRHLSLLGDLLEVAKEIDSSLATQTPGLRHAFPPDGVAALAAIRASGGRMVVVDDEEAIYWRERLAVETGILAEPSATTALAAAAKLRESGNFTNDEAVVCIITGAGWRDLPDLAIQAKIPIHAVEAQGRNTLGALLAVADGE